MDREKMLQNHRPIDRAAARVVYGKADHWSPFPGGRQIVYDICPALGHPRPGQHDFTGVKCGELTVLGLAPRGGQWVARCSCGCFVVRSTKSIRDYAPEKSQTGWRCARCSYKRKIFKSTY